MEFIERGRQGGKTHYLMTEIFLKSKSHFLIVMNESEKQRLIRQYRLMSKNEQDRIITYENARYKMQHVPHDRRDFCIDNLDDYLRHMFMAEPVAATLNGKIDKTIK